MKPFTSKIAPCILSLILSANVMTACTDPNNCQNGTRLSQNQAETTQQYVDSSAITTKVKAKLLADSQIKSFPITVNTYKSTVQLSGFVHSKEQARRAQKIAESVPGVTAVKNDLIVQ